MGLDQKSIIQERSTNTITKHIYRQLNKNPVPMKVSKLDSKVESTIKSPESSLSRSLLINQYLHRNKRSEWLKLINR